MPDGTFHKETEMTILAHRPFALCGTGPSALGRTIRWIARESRIARDTEHLARMSDHELRDIGIARREIAQAVRHGRDLRFEGPGTAGPLGPNQSGPPLALLRLAGELGRPERTPFNPRRRP